MEKFIGRKKGDTASKDVTAAHGPLRQAAHGPLRQSAHHHTYTTFSSTGDTAADELKKQVRSPSLEGTMKPTAVEGDYNIFNITPFYLCILCNTPYHHIAILPCENRCAFCAPFHHISLHKSVPIHFTISPFLHMNMGVYSMHHFTIFVSP